MNSSWFQIQQDIHRYVGVLTAFLLVIGLSRLMCYETEQKTAGLVGTAAHGPSLTWRAKVGLSLLYCTAVVFVLGAVTLGIRGALIGFQDAFTPVSECVHFESVPLSNLTYCIKPLQPPEVPHIRRLAVKLKNGQTAGPARNS